MLDETGQLVQMLKARFQGSLGQFAQREFVSIVADLLKHGIEVVGIEDQLHESLRLAWKPALDFILILFTFHLVLGLVFVIFVVLLQECILALFGRFGSLIPLVAGLVFELLVEFFSSAV